MARVPLKLSPWEIKLDTAIKRLEQTCDETANGWLCRLTGKLFALSVGANSIHVYENQGVRRGVEVPPVHPPHSRASFMDRKDIQTMTPKLVRYGVTLYTTSKLYGETLPDIFASDYDYAQRQATYLIGSLVNHPAFIRVEVYRK